MSEYVNLYAVTTALLELFDNDTFCLVVLNLYTDKNISCTFTSVVICWPLKQNMATSKYAPLINRITLTIVEMSFP